MSKTIEQTQQYVNKFYETLLISNTLQLIRKDDALEKITKKAISAVISDPRGALRWKDISFQFHLSDVEMNETILNLKAKIGHNVEIMRLVHYFIDIGNYDSNSNKNVTSEQRKMFESAAKFLFDKNHSEEIEKSVLQIVQGRYKPFGCHPSVCFLVGMLCYKSGHSGNLEHAYKLFEYARNGILLEPTCVVLQALTVFWAAKCGKFSIDKSKSYPEVDKLVVNVVLDRLRHALSIADASAEKPTAVEASLMIDLHSAISLCEKWTNELDQSKSDFTFASTLFEKIPWVGTPPVLLLRAGRALDLNVPGIIGWLQLDRMIEIDSRLGPSRMHRQLWPNLLTTPMNPWDSGAFIFEFETYSEHLKMKSIEEVETCWWYKLSTKESVEVPVDFLIEICEICGSEAIQKCSACKQVRYCSRKCQKADWLVLHKDICGQI